MKKIALVLSLILMLSTQGHTWEIPKAAKVFFVTGVAFLGASYVLHQRVLRFDERAKSLNPDEAYRASWGSWGYRPDRDHLQQEQHSYVRRGIRCREYQQIAQAIGAGCLGTSMVVYFDAGQESREERYRRICIEGRWQF